MSLEQPHATEYAGARKRSQEGPKILVWVRGKRGGVNAIMGRIVAVAKNWIKIRVFGHDEVIPKDDIEDIVPRD